MLWSVQIAVHSFCSQLALSAGEVLAQKIVCGLVEYITEMTFKFSITDHREGSFREGSGDQLELIYQSETEQEVCMACQKYLYFET